MLFLLVKKKHYVEIKAQIDFLHLTLYMHMSCEHLVFPMELPRQNLLLFDSKSHVPEKPADLVEVNTFTDRWLGQLFYMRAAEFTEIFETMLGSGAAIEK